MSMNITLSQSEYDKFKARSEAFDAIDRIISAEPDTDEHGNSIPYAYRFDQEISAIMDVLDEVKSKERERETIRIPWFRETDRQISRLFG